METLAFIIGGIFTLTVFAAGMIFNKLTSSKNLEETAEKIKRKFTPPPPPTSGSVKAITPDEIKKEKDKGFISKMQDIIS